MTQIVPNPPLALLKPPLLGLAHVRGEAEDIGSFDAGGSWFSVGINYQFPTKPARPLRRMF